MKRRQPALSITPGAIIRTYSPAEASDWTEQWLRVYGQNRLGANTKAFLWHVFSFERYPALSGTAAQAEYERQQAHEYVVLSNDRDSAVLTNEQPVKASHSDVLVFPANFAWTFALTHEDGWLGPYFARHRHYDALNAANLARVEKERQAEEARRKGWA